MFFDHMASQAVFGCLSYVIIIFYFSLHILSVRPQIRFKPGSILGHTLKLFEQNVDNLLVFYGYPSNMAPNMAVFGTIFACLKT